MNVISALMSVNLSGAAAHRAFFAGHLSYPIAALLLTPAFICAQLDVQNGAAVMFPAWITLGASRARGVEAMGQRLLMMAGIMLVLVVSVIPAALVAALVTAVVYFSTGVLIIVLPAAIIGVVMIVECLLVIEWLGRVLERTDVTAIEAVE